jgi:hypothetical protein
MRALRNDMYVHNMPCFLAVVFERNVCSGGQQRVKVAQKRKTKWYSGPVHRQHVEPVRHTAFQWFLIAFSVRPGSFLAILLH